MTWIVGAMTQKPAINVLFVVLFALMTLEEARAYEERKGMRKNPFHVQKKETGKEASSPKDIL